MVKMMMMMMLLTMILMVLIYDDIDDDDDNYNNNDDANEYDAYIYDEYAKMSMSMMMIMSSGYRYL